MMSSPNPNTFRADSTGTLKTTITLGKNPSVQQSGPFYLIRAENIEESEATGSSNLLEHNLLESSYYKMCNVKKLKDELSSFLPNLPGFCDVPAAQDKSSLKDLYDNPPRVHKELDPLPNHLLGNFRLNPGQLPEKFRLMDINAMKKQHKKRRRREEAAAGAASAEQEAANAEAKRQRKEKDEERHAKKKEERRRAKAVMAGAMPS
ncbi:mediator of RNA polymerase II transcription subunit 19-like [Paramacrobiotus metropolitanus]|uniref:mediator of RNA polymerase II transcription subunit 19-like n=1 Tax=Paramacrobiotus metropolitanus TaxID=2943436 RepID=UPI002445F913|nr:mediator of RNA polymerase II transcription subunit 19-like [Paramacrobiotus metropolitanus]